jgi:thiamine-phosphate pyrophosphorylase
MTDTEFPRLFLVTPPRVDLDAFSGLLGEALRDGDVAAVLIALDAGDERQAAVQALVRQVQDAGAAAIVLDDTRLAGHVKADGVHISTGVEDLRLAAKSFQPRSIVGAGNLTSRHAAMEAGEAGADYVFFGRPHGDTHPGPHPKALELAEWWSEVTSIPAVVMGGHSIDSLPSATETGASFIALHNAVWSHASGPCAAVRRAHELLSQSRRRAA